VFIALAQKLSLPLNAPHIPRHSAAILPMRGSPNVATRHLTPFRFPDIFSGMEKERLIEVLRRVQTRLAYGVKPTVRDAALTEAEARWMSQEGLISLGDKKSWNKSAQETTPFEDRYVIFELSDKAKGILIDAGQ
jgi:hypothetical protein